MTEMTTQPPSAPPGLGDNLPPEDEAAFDELSARTSLLIENANRWANERPVILSDEEATKAGDYLDQVRIQLKLVDAARKKAKQPWRDGAEKVDQRYNPFKRPLEIAGNMMKTLLTPWLADRAREQQAEQRKAEAIARKAQEEAEAMIREAEEKTGGDVVGRQVAAEEAVLHSGQATRDAVRAAKAPKVASAHGGRAKSFRVRIVVKITDPTKIPVRYLRALCAQSYVSEALERAVKTQPTFYANVAGIEITEERTVQ